MAPRLASQRLLPSANALGKSEVRRNRSSGPVLRGPGLKRARGLSSHPINRGHRHRESMNGSPQLMVPW